MSRTTGRPPEILRVLTCANFPLGYALEILFQEMLKPEFAGLFGAGPANNVRFHDEGITLGLHGGDRHSFATLEFALRDGSTLCATFRHPSDEGQPDPSLVVRLSLGHRALAAIAAVCFGVPNAEAIAAGIVSPLPVVFPPPVPASAIAPKRFKRARFTPENAERFRQGLPPIREEY